MSEGKFGAQSSESTELGLKDSEWFEEKDWGTSVFRGRL